MFPLPINDNNLPTRQLCEPNLHPIPNPKPKPIQTSQKPLPRTRTISRMHSWLMFPSANQPFNLPLPPPCEPNLNPNTNLLSKPSERPNLERELEIHLGCTRGSCFPPLSNQSNYEPNSNPSITFDCYSQLQRTTPPTGLPFSAFSQSTNRPTQPPRLGT